MFSRERRINLEVDYLSALIPKILDPNVGISFGTNFALKDILQNYDSIGMSLG